MIDRSRQLTNLQYQTRKESLLELLAVFNKNYHDATKGIEKYKKELAELDGRYLERYNKQLDKDYKALKDIENEKTS